MRILPPEFDGKFGHRKRCAGWLVLRFGNFKFTALGANNRSLAIPDIGPIRPRDWLAAAWRQDAVLSTTYGI